MTILEKNLSYIYGFGFIEIGFFSFTIIQSERGASIQQHRTKNIRRSGSGLVSGFRQWIAVQAQTLAFAQSQRQRAFHSDAHVASRWRKYRQAKSFQKRTNQRWALPSFNASFVIVIVIETVLHIRRIRIINGKYNDVALKST